MNSVGKISGWYWWVPKQPKLISESNKIGLKCLAELEKLRNAKPRRCWEYEQICISLIPKSINNIPHCQETARGYSLPEKWPLVCIYLTNFCKHRQVLIFGNSDILDLAQKSQVNSSVATEVIVRSLFFMGQEILSATYWYKFWDPW